MAALLPKIPASSFAIVSMMLTTAPQMVTFRICFSLSSIFNSRLTNIVNSSAYCPAFEHVFGFFVLVWGILPCFEHIFADFVLILAIYLNCQK
jgi:uncharacterized membrane protein YdcZ (DUF606 family)